MRGDKEDVGKGEKETCEQRSHLGNDAQQGEELAGEVRGSMCSEVCPSVLHRKSCQVGMFWFKNSWWGKKAAEGKRQKMKAAVQELLLFKKRKENKESFKQLGGV